MADARDEIRAALEEAKKAREEADRVRREAEVEAERLRADARRYTEEAGALNDGRSYRRNRNEERESRRQARAERRQHRMDWRWQDHLTLKVSSLLSLFAVWASAVTAVAIRGDAWPILIFAALATLVIGGNAWRRLGLSRLIAISGIWAGAALIAAVDDGRAWPALFALFTTATVVFGTLDRRAWVLGLGIAAPWLATGWAVGVHGHEVAWMVVVAFFTTFTVANRRALLPGILAVTWWGLVGGAVVVGGPEWAWLSPGAIVLAWVPGGSGGPRFNRGFEWDLWSRDSERTFDAVEPRHG